MSRWEPLAAGGLLLGVLTAFFWPAVLGGRVLLPADLIYDLDPLWQELAPQGYAGPSNHLLADQVYQFYPWRSFAIRTLARGEVPLWNPYTYGGQPFVGNAQSAVFDPFNLLSALVSLNASRVVLVLSRLSVAGIFTFLFARQIGLGRIGALLAMLAFTLSGTMIGWIGYPLASVVAWLPAMLWAADRALTRRSWAYAVGCGLIIGAQFLGGHPETSLLVLLAWAAYCLCRAVALDGWQPSDLFRRLRGMIVVGAMGIALGAVQLVPFAEALLQSDILIARQSRAAAGAGALLRNVVFDWHNWPTVITMLLPQYFGTPVEESYLYPFSNYVEQNAYVGVLPLALALFTAWSLLRRRSWVLRREAAFLVLLAAVSLSMAIRLPFINLANHLPPLSISAPGRLRLVYAFATSILAGMGFDQIVRGQTEDRRLLLRILGLLALGALLAIALTYEGLVFFRQDIIAYGRTYVASQWGSPHFPRSLEHYYALVELRYEKSLSKFLPGNATMYLPLIVALACLAFHLWRRKRGAPRAWHLASLGLALTLLDVFLTGASFNPTTSPDRVYPTPAAIQFLRQDTDVYRILGTGMILNPNSSVLFEIQDVRGYDPIAPARYVHLLAQLPGYFRVSHYSLFDTATSPLLDLLNVKYLLTEQELSGRWELAYRGPGEVRVYRNRSALPRAFLVYRAQIVPDDQASLDMVTGGDLDFRREVVLESKPPGWAEPAEPVTVGAQVKIVDYDPTRIHIAVESPAKGLLVLTDTYMPGWRGQMDGEFVQVYPADHAFRAIVVPAGTHQVEFVYRPTGFRLGAAVSSLTILVLLLLLLASVATRGRSASRSAGG